MSFVSGRAASDEFWKWFSQGCFFGAFDPPTLRGIINESSIVIRGSILEIGTVNTLGWATISLRVLPTEVLKGEPITRGDGTLEVQIGIDYDASEVPRSVPAHENLWFLRTDNESARYYATDYAQMSIVRNINGMARIIKVDGVTSAYSKNVFPARFEGTDFEALVQDVRELSGTSTQRLLHGASVDGRGRVPAAVFAC